MTDEEKRRRQNESSARWRKRHKKQVAEYQKRYREKHREEKNKRDRERYLARCIAHLCAKCGKPLEDEKYMTCKKCRERVRTRRRGTSE